MTNHLILREVVESDLPIFFEQQLDPDANFMAAFTAADPTERDAFMAHWARILADERIIKMTIVVDGQVAGSVSSFEQFGKPSVSYWLGRSFWGRGIATGALSALLRLVPTRPLYARVAKDNLASLRVLQKCGYAICGEDRGYANARGTEVEEFILRLDTHPEGDDAVGD